MRPIFRKIAPEKTSKHPARMATVAMEEQIPQQSLNGMSYFYFGFLIGMDYPNAPKEMDPQDAHTYALIV
jgi:hypothetical protein